MASMTIYPSRDRWLWMGFRGDTEPTEVDAFRYGQFFEISNSTPPLRYQTANPWGTSKRSLISPPQVIGHAHARNRNIIQRYGEKPNK